MVYQFLDSVFLIFVFLFFCSSLLNNIFSHSLSDCVLVALLPWLVEKIIPFLQFRNALILEAYKFSLIVPANLRHTWPFSRNFLSAFICKVSLSPQEMFETRFCMLVIFKVQTEEFLRAHDEDSSCFCQLMHCAMFMESVSALHITLESSREYTEQEFHGSPEGFRRSFNNDSSVMTEAALIKFTAAVVLPLRGLS